MDLEVPCTVALRNRRLRNGLWHTLLFGTATWLRDSESTNNPGIRKVAQCPLFASQSFGPASDGQQAQHDAAREAARGWSHHDAVIRDDVSTEAVQQLQLLVRECNPCISRQNPGACERSFVLSRRCLLNPTPQKLSTGDETLTADCRSSVRIWWLKQSSMIFWVSAQTLTPALSRRHIT